MSAALKEYRERYRAARARLWQAPVEPAQRPRDILRIASPCKIYDKPIGPRVPALGEISMPETSASHARKIMREVCSKYGVTIADICSGRRPPYLVTARQEACYRLRMETTWGLERIGGFLGGRDHTTVRWGVMQHKKRMEAAS